MLTAGTTNRGVIDPLKPCDAAWTHVDAPWAGPLVFTRYAHRLAGIEQADSVAISAHKWLFQPKDSAVVLFADAQAQDRVSFGGAYLAVPNVGVQGSRGAAALPLFATLLAWGRSGLAARIEAQMALSEALAARLGADPRAMLLQQPESAVVNWRPAEKEVDVVYAALGGAASKTVIAGAPTLRHVAANLNATIDAVWARIDAALG